MVVRDEIENIFFEIRAGRADPMHLVLPDHFRERESQLRRAHRAANRHEHLSAARQVRDVGLRSIHDDCRVEVPVMVPDEISYAHVRLSLRNLCTEHLLRRNPMLHAPMIQAQIEIIFTIEVASSG